MDVIERLLFALVFVTIIFTAFSIAFTGLPIKRYISEENTDRMESLAEQYVAETRPSFFGQIYFFFSSFITMLKTIFQMLTSGLVNVIFDVGGILNVPLAITSLLAGVLIFILAYFIIKKIAGR